MQIQADQGRDFFRCGMLILMQAKRKKESSV